MNILDYLDKESPEVLRALQHGFRKGDTDAIGRAVLEEIKARQLLVKVLNERLILCEKEFPGIGAKFNEIDVALKGESITAEPATVQSGETDEVVNARLNQIDERINIIASGLVTIVNSLSS